MTDQLSADQLGAGDPDDEPVGAGAAATDGAAASDPGRASPGGAWLRRRVRRRNRVSRWDRPPEPRDWRFFVGGLGRALIVTGMLLFGFVAYQLWGTGIETARAQHRLENEFEELVARYAADPEPDDGGRPVVDDAAPGDADDAAPVDLDDDGDTATGVDPPGDAADPVGGPVEQPATDGGDEPIERVDLSAIAVEQDIPPFERGDPLALLEIPAIGTSDIVVPGVSLDDLKSGPGHYPDTPLPGQLGNAAIAGHRTTYGAPFFDVDQLVPGDELIVTMFTGDRFVYVVTSVDVVGAADYWVVSTGDPTVAELTLTSCHPKYTARDRIIVRGLLDPERSSVVGVPTSYDLGSGVDEPIPGDDPVIAVESGDPSDGEPTVEPDEPVEAVEDGDATGPATDELVGDDPPTGDAPVDARSDDLTTPVPSPPAEDVFVNGWFDDRGAWPQIALWGAVLIMIAVLAHRVSRRFRNLAVGTALGLLPFLVALYFFYQNVHRLLPPGL